MLLVDLLGAPKSQMIGMRRRVWSEKAQDCQRLHGKSRRIMVTGCDKNKIDGFEFLSKLELIIKGGQFGDTRRKIPRLVFNRAKTRWKMNGLFS